MRSSAIQIEGGGKGVSSALPRPLDLRRRIPELDGIRGIAISMVLIWHLFVTQLSAPMRSWGAYALAAGRLTWSGVDLFFVLSGFLIGGVLLDAKDASNYFAIFYRRRFFRIIPIYVLLLTGSLLVFELSRRGLAGRLTPLSEARLRFLPFVFFVQNFWMVFKSTYGAALLAVTWSLAVEEQFYLTLPLLIRFVRRLLPTFLVFGVLLAPIFRFTIHVLWPSRDLAWYMLMPCRADALLLGVLGALLLRNGGCRTWLGERRSTCRFLLGVLIVGVAVLTKYSAHLFDESGLWTATFGFTWLALFYLSVILYSLMWRDSLLSRCLKWNGLCWLGSIAYGVYLFHFPLLYATYALIWARPPQIVSLANLLVTCLVLTGTLGVCWLSWNFFEKPLVKVGHRQGYRFRILWPTLDDSKVVVSES